MNKRSFLNTLAGAMAAAMLPFRPEPPPVFFGTSFMVLRKERCCICGQQECDHLSPKRLNFYCYEEIGKFHCPPEHLKKIIARVKFA